MNHLMSSSWNHEALQREIVRHCVHESLFSSKSPFGFKTIYNQPVRETLRFEEFERRISFVDLAYHASRDPSMPGHSVCAPENSNYKKRSNSVSPTTHAR